MGESENSLRYIAGNLDPRDVEKYVGADVLSTSSPVLKVSRAALACMLANTASLGAEVERLRKQLAARDCPTCNGTGRNEQGFCDGPWRSITS